MIGRDIAIVTLLLLVCDSAAIAERLFPSIPGVPLPDVGGAFSRGKGGLSIQQSPGNYFESELYSRKAAAPIFLAPWAAGLASNQRLLPSFFCGATIIGHRWAVTAAYCVDDVRLDDISILSGSASISGAKQTSIEGTIIHPDYQKGHFQNSIALLRTNQDIEIAKSSIVGTPAISRSEADDAVVDAKVFGWGAIVEDGSPTNNLLQLDVVVVDRGTCNSPVAYGGKVTNDMICARSRVRGIDTCQGFSGSGLISYPAGAPELFGIVSWGEGCGREGKPTVYLKVGHFREWIAQYVKE
jgi:secreted trypsin-like serine protease